MDQYSFFNSSQKGDFYKNNVFETKCPNTGHPDTLNNMLNNLMPTNQY